MLCGILAGVCAFLFGHQVGEPQIDRAVAFEAHVQAAAGLAPEPQIVSRGLQSGLGLFTAVSLIGIALGGLFAIGCAFAYGRLGALRIRAISALFACVGFVGIVLVPSLKYPANPPAVGIPATIGVRTELFFSSIALSLCFLVLAGLAAHALAPRWGMWNACVSAGLAYLVAIAFAQAFLPDVNEVPNDFPALVLWKFRVASLETQAILWGTLGLSFGFLCELAEAGSQAA